MHELPLLLNIAVALSFALAGGLIANTSKIPMITPSSTNVKVTEGREYVFRVCFTDDAQGVAARGEVVVTEYGNHRIQVFRLADGALVAYTAL